MTLAGTEFAPPAPGRVRVVFVHGFLDDAGVWDDVIARLPATVDTPVAAGETYDFAVAVGNVRSFDTETGRRTEPVRT